MKTDGITITELRAENVKRIKAVRMRPGERGLVVLGGRNGAGKSSVLDSIVYALTGGKSIPEEPIRRGEDEAEIEIKTSSGLVVKRTFKGEKSQLTVKSADGVRENSPQGILDAIVGPIAFDPLSLISGTGEQRMKRLRTMFGLDFAPLDAQRTRYYNERTAANALLKSAEDHLAIIKETAPLKFPEARRDMAEVDRLERELREAHQAKSTAAAEVIRANAKIEQHQATLKMLQDRVNKLRKELEEAEKNLASAHSITIDLTHAAQNAIETHAAIVVPDPAAITKLRDEVTAHNRLVDQRLALEATAGKIANFKKQSDDLTTRIAGIDADKQRLIAEAFGPDSDITFGDDDLMYQGLPFSQASTGEQIKAAIGLCLKHTPALRVILCREGSLLDDRNMEYMAQVAEEYGVQVWVERVGKGEECSVIIEDGEIVEDRAGIAGAP